MSPLPPTERKEAGQPVHEADDRTRLRPHEITRKVKEMLKDGPFVSYPLMRASLMAERARRVLSGEHKFSRSMFTIKIFEDLLHLNAETENRHDLLAGASGVWSHEATFAEPLSEGTLPIEAMRMILQLEEEQHNRLQQLEKVFKQMQSGPETPGEIPANLAFADRFKSISSEKWVNLVERYNVKPVDLCLLPETQELRPRTPDELQTIRVVLRDKAGEVRSLYYRFSDSGSGVHDVATKVNQLWTSHEDIGKPVEHPFFEIEIDLTDTSQESGGATDLLNPQLGAREAIANSASVCHCKLDHQRVGFYYPHFSNNEGHGWDMAEKVLRVLKKPFRQTEPQTKVIDRRTSQEPGGEKLQELELVSGFSFLPEESAWHANALKLFEQPPTLGETDKAKPSFVQLVGMAQGFLTESTTYLCVAAEKADLQLALLPFIGKEASIVDFLAKLRSIRELPGTAANSLAQLTSTNISEIIEEMKKVTYFTNRDIADCRAGQGVVAQLYVSTNEVLKQFFSQLFPKMHGQLQKGPAQISKIFHEGDKPVIFTTAVDQHASIGIAIADRLSGKAKSRQLTLRLRLEQEEIAQLREQHPQEADLTAAALKQVEQQTQELRQTMIDLSFILQLTHAQTSEEQLALLAHYQNLVARTQPQLPSAAETIVSRPQMLRPQALPTPDTSVPPEPEQPIPSPQNVALTVFTPPETAMMIPPPLETALIVHPTLGPATTRLTEEQSQSSDQPPLPAAQ